SPASCSSAACSTTCSMRPTLRIATTRTTASTWRPRRCRDRVAWRQASCSAVRSNSPARSLLSDELAELGVELVCADRADVWRSDATAPAIEYERRRQRARIIERQQDVRVLADDRELHLEVTLEVEQLGVARVIAREHAEHHDALR